MISNELRIQFQRDYSHICEDLRYVKFNEELPLEVLEKIDQVLNGITFIYPYLT